MIDAKIVKNLVLNSMVVVVKFSGICSIATKIYDPKFELIDSVIILSSNSEADDNELQVDIRDFIINPFNTSENKLVFNSIFNFANSLSIKQIDIA